MIIACSAVLFYVILTNLVPIWDTITMIVGFFSPLIFGCILAYIINPLAKSLFEKPFKKIKNERGRWVLSVVLALIIVIMVLGFMLGTLIPQLFDSIKTFSSNLDGYVVTMRVVFKRWQISRYIDVDKFLDSSENLWKIVIDYVKDNIGNIVDASAGVGKSLVNWALGFILSIYLLIAKNQVKSFFATFFRALLPTKRYDGFRSFLCRCDGILSHYITYSLIEGILIGITNAIFMAVMRMQYIGMISVVVGVTNLIPTFGPIIGGLIGAFILLLIKPWHALAFIIFTLVLQTVDGYVVKPNLFGDSLGVSGLLILATIIIGGKMFGVVGILLAIPFAAILDFLYKDYFIVALQARRLKDDEENAKSENAPPDEDNDDEK